MYIFLNLFYSAEGLDIQFISNNTIH